MCPVKLMMLLGDLFRLSLQKSRETPGGCVKAVVTGKISITSVLCSDVAASAGLAAYHCFLSLGRVGG